MAKTGTLRVSVCEAWPDSAWLVCLVLPPGATVRDALLASAYPDRACGVDLQALSLGVFGQRCSLDTPLCDGDRIEIYRPLVFDPMESRRRRAALKAQGMPGMQRRRRTALP